MTDLSDHNTPERYRRRFEENNPIPGATWVNHVLINADEIIPNNYTVNNLRDDIEVLETFVKQLEKHVPKMVNGTIDFKSSGKLSTFVCNKMSNLRVPNREPNEPLNQYYRRAYPTGNIK